jgi:hypothetical protein
MVFLSPFFFESTRPRLRLTHGRTCQFIGAGQHEYAQELMESSAVFRVPKMQFSSFIRIIQDT